MTVLKWRDQIRTAARVNDTLQKRQMRHDIYIAWLENRVYSVWPKQPHDKRMPEMRWHAAALSQMFTRREITLALYSHGDGDVTPHPERRDGVQRTS
jgi:hypothetical protein